MNWSGYSGDKALATLKEVLGETLQSTDIRNDSVYSVVISTPNGPIRIDGEYGLRVFTPKVITKYKVKWSVMDEPTEKEFIVKTEADAFVEKLSEAYSITAEIEEFQTIDA
jgi:hypothetical protein